MIEFVITWETRTRKGEGRNYFRTFYEYTEAWLFAGRTKARANVKRVQFREQDAEEYTAKDAAGREYPGVKIHVLRMFYI